MDSREHDALVSTAWELGIVTTDLSPEEIREAVRSKLEREKQEHDAWRERIAEYEADDRD